MGSILALITELEFRNLNGSELALGAQADALAVDGDRLLPVPDVVEGLARLSRRQHDARPLQDARLQRLLVFRKRDLWRQKPVHRK